MNYLTKIVSGLAFTLLYSSTLSIANENSVKTKELAVFYTIKGNIEDKYNALLETKVKSIGFKLTDPHKRVNDQYKIKYGSSILDVLSFMSIVNDSAILPLLNIDPRMAGFAPFNMIIHKKLDEKESHVGHLQPKVMLDILGIDNKEVREKFTATFATLDTMIEKELGGTKSIMPYAKLPQKRMMNFEYEFETPEDIDDFIDEFQEKFEEAFIDKEYLIAGYHNFMEATSNATEVLKDYDAFWTYSLCHLEFSYNMFDNKGARPEAGLFAPCTMYMYIRKGSNKVVIGMLRLQNWTDTLNIINKKRLTLAKKLDIEIPEILTSLGMKAVPNVNPLLTLSAANTTVTTKVEIDNTQKIESPKKILEKKESSLKTQIIKTATGDVRITLPTVPKPIKAIDLGTNKNKRGITFSKRVPPNYIPHRFDIKKKEKSLGNTRIGEVTHGRISAYLRGEYMEVASVEEKLKAAGFTILTSSPLNKKADLTSVVFTEPSLIAQASKINRGFMATLRVLVDSKERKISITNPLYISKGFLQDEYNESLANKILIKLLEKFPKLQNSKDALKFQLLPKYQFMNGMPHYEDMIEVASGNDLLKRIKDNKNIVFTQTLENGSTLVGIKLGKRTRKFPKRIGRNNAAMLPYPILIENGKAKILDPKYYISFMYPLLQMSEFMTIATIPDAMTKDCERIFQK